MSRILSEKIHVARKQHRCEALQYITEEYEDGLYTYAELREIVKALRQRGLILPGQPYLKVVQIWEGEFCVFKATPTIDNICQKYNLYPYE